MALLPRTLIVFKNGDLGLIQGSGLDPSDEQVYEKLDISTLSDNDFEDMQNNLDDLVTITRILEKYGIEFSIEGEVDEKV